jgi:DNA-binding GntR family transcriptional regulator
MFFAGVPAEKVVLSTNGTTDLAVIRKTVQKSRRALDAGDGEASLLLNNDFHAAQARTAHNEFLVQHLHALWAYVNLLGGRSWVATERVREAHAEPVLRAVHHRLTAPDTPSQTHSSNW